MASLLNQLAIIQRELGRFDDATRSLGRSIELLDSLVAADAHPPALREQLVAAHEALAYTWQINPAELGARQADRQYRQALTMYQDLERDWPNRRQPVGLCLRRLGELAFQRGDIAEAEQYWRQAIASGEAYLREQPGNIDARATLCWTCIGLCDLMLAPAQNRPEAAASILATGLAHAAIILQANPRSTSGREVAAFLRFRLAQCYCRTGKPDEAIGLFHEAIGETESLCVEFPWNGPHWDNAIYIHREVISSLKRADRGADAHRATRQMVDWLKRIAPALPDEPAPQAELLRCRDALVAILRSAGQDQEAKELEATVQPTKLPAGASPGK
jgi:tetratricopeptide (TPR) repeat protein